MSSHSSEIDQVAAILMTINDGHTNHSNDQAHLDNPGGTKRLEIEKESDHPNGTKKLKTNNKKDGLERRETVLWSIEEIERLVAATHLYGKGHWAMVKKKEFSTDRRSAVDIKDKWDNLTTASQKLPLYRKKVLSKVKEETWKVICKINSDDPDSKAEDEIQQICKINNNVPDPKAEDEIPQIASTRIISSISDDRGEELSYAGLPISAIVKDSFGIGGTISLLWFKRSLPKYCEDFFELCLVLCADDGPCVPAAHNTIVTARAGQDLVSSLVSGLLTMGDQNGGTINNATRYFKEAYDKGLQPEEFVLSMEKKGIHVPGIGHRIKRGDSRDKRVELLQTFARLYFPSVKYMEYAVGVETCTLLKSSDLILNLDGMIGSLSLDLLVSSAMFNNDEIAEFVRIGYFSGLFVLARSIGLIGHTFDQKRLKQPIYIHPEEHVNYTK